MKKSILAGALLALAVSAGSHAAPMFSETSALDDAVTGSLLPGDETTAAEYVEYDGYSEQPVLHSMYEPLPEHWIFMSSIWTLVRFDFHFELSGPEPVHLAESHVPEPGSLALGGIALAGLLAARRRKAK